MLTMRSRQHGQQGQRPALKLRGIRRAGPIGVPPHVLREISPGGGKQGSTHAAGDSASSRDSSGPRVEDAAAHGAAGAGAELALGMEGIESDGRLAVGAAGCSGAAAEACHLLSAAQEALGGAPDAAAAAPEPEVLVTAAASEAAAAPAGCSSSSPHIPQQQQQQQSPPPPQQQRQLLAPSPTPAAPTSPDMPEPLACSSPPWTASPPMHHGTAFPGLSLSLRELLDSLVYQGSDSGSPQDGGGGSPLMSSLRSFSFMPRGQQLPAGGKDFDQEAASGVQQVACGAVDLEGGGYSRDEAGSSEALRVGSPVSTEQLEPSAVTSPAAAATAAAAVATAVGDEVCDDGGAGGFVDMQGAAGVDVLISPAPSISWWRWQKEAAAVAAEEQLQRFDCAPATPSFGARTPLAHDTASMGAPSAPRADGMAAGAEQTHSEAPQQQQKQQPPTGASALPASPSPHPTSAPQITDSDDGIRAVGGTLGAAGASADLAPVQSSPIGQAAPPPGQPPAQLSPITPEAAQPTMQRLRIAASRPASRLLEAALGSAGTGGVGGSCNSGGGGAAAAAGSGSISALLLGGGGRDSPLQVARGGRQGALLSRRGMMLMQQMAKGRQEQEERKATLQLEQQQAVGPDQQRHEQEQQLPPTQQQQQQPLQEEQQQQEQQQAEFEPHGQEDQQQVQVLGVSLSLQPQEGARLISPCPPLSAAAAAAEAAAVETAAVAAGEATKRKLWDPPREQVGVATAVQQVQQLPVALQVSRPHTAAAAAAVEAEAVLMACQAACHSCSLHLAVAGEHGDPAAGLLQGAGKDNMACSSPITEQLSQGVAFVAGGGAGEEVDQGCVLPGHRCCHGLGLRDPGGDVEMQVAQESEEGTLGRVEVPRSGWLFAGQRRAMHPASAMQRQQQEEAEDGEEEEAEEEERHAQWGRGEEKGCEKEGEEGEDGQQLVLEVRHHGDLARGHPRKRRGGIRRVLQVADGCSDYGATEQEQQQCQQQQLQSGDEHVVEEAAGGRTARLSAVADGRKDDRRAASSKGGDAGAGGEPSAAGSSPCMGGAKVCSDTANQGDQLPGFDRRGLAGVDQEGLTIRSALFTEAGAADADAHADPIGPDSPAAGPRRRPARQHSRCSSVDGDGGGGNEPDEGDGMPLVPSSPQAATPPPASPPVKATAPMRPTLAPDAALPAADAAVQAATAGGAAAAAAWSPAGPVRPGAHAHVRTPTPSPSPAAAAAAAAARCCVSPLDLVDIPRTVVYVRQPRRQQQQQSTPQRFGAGRPQLWGAAGNGDGRVSPYALRYPPGSLAQHAAEQAAANRLARLGGGVYSGARAGVGVAGGGGVGVGVGGQLGDGAGTAAAVETLEQRLRVAFLELKLALEAAGGAVWARLGMAGLELELDGPAGVYEQR